MTVLPLTPAGLRCAHQADPLGVAPDRVRLSWRLEGTGGSRAQRAYQVLVTDDAGAVAWDSGRVESAAAMDIAYGGSPLTAGGRYRWKVRVWDETGLGSDWSVPARFEVELDRTGGWYASWITPSRTREGATPPSGRGPADPVARALTPAPYLRRAFTLDQPVASARLYVTALGLYEARLNGRRVGDGFLTPGWTDYTQRIAYQAYDVTGLLAEGENVLGAILADGWYAGFYGFDPKRAGAHYGTVPELLAQLVLRLADGPEEGRVQRIVTDGQWESATGAIRHADLLMGERHDLTREPHGWDVPGFDADGWHPVRVRERDGMRLVADPGPPVRVTQEIAPRSIATDDHGRHIVDFGQNLTGWLQLKVEGPPGTQIRIRHGEVLAADGSLYTDNLRTARAIDEFTTAGGLEVLEPRFTLHGFRYAEITGYPGDIGQAGITARVVHSDTPATGNFESSQPWLDQLFATIDWSQRGNFISVPTDCPQRDERLGWLGDAQVFARTACYNRDVAAFFAKWLD
ncbi:MAG TPA: family 78 glycoside hydrolase catalytic domain, partial [Streptosporangiaceae bacterium]|nr:family 78 glycoside hydrolase catalytic domain [Streptosporangiaceae bacterium]